MKIWIITLTGKRILIDDVKPETTIEELRLKLETKEGITPILQGLIFKGKMLCDGYQIGDVKYKGNKPLSYKYVDNTISSIGISDNDVLHLVIRLRG